MNYPTPKDHLSAAFTLDSDLSNLSVQSSSRFEYSDDGGEVLYVTQGELVAHTFEQPIQLETAEACSSNVSGTWEYISNESKNLDSIVDELGPEEVRWFYKSETDKRWLEFSGYDSLRIEFKYRQLYQEWHFYNNENTWANVEDNTSSALNLDDSSGLSSSHTKQSPGDVLSDREHKIVVRGGMYEVDLHEWKCLSIYWPGEECGITRGNWFYDGTWQPLEVDQSNRMEMFHLEKFYGHKLCEYHIDPASRIPKSVLHTLSFPEFHVDWYSPTDVYLYSEATPSKLVRSFTQKLGFQKSTGYRLFRGYREHATQTDRPVDITHLVFVIHGIGQKMDTGRIIRNTSSFRDCVTWLKQKYFSSSTYRAEFFPVEWRSSLTLDGDIVDCITPHKLLGLRQILNASAMDIMYYTSPLYGNEVQQGLTVELNRLYSMFARRNPYFTANGGKVSVVAHSLGCVIVYDIITGWRPDSWQTKSVPDDLPSCSHGLKEPPADETSEQGTPSSNKSRLLFQIDNMFCLGSPLSVFLALRWRNPESNILPPSLCRRFYNVFHPSDPVAYRMEPLIVREYCRIAPIQIQAYNVGIHPNYDSLPLEPLIAEASTSATTTSTVSLPKKDGESDSESASSVTPSGTPSKDRSWSIWGLMRGSWKAQDGASSPQFDSLSGGLQHRLDFVLRETNLGGSYLSALTSHTAYWSNYDVAYFVLTRLFPDLEGDAEVVSIPSPDPVLQ